MLDLLIFSVDLYIRYILIFTFLFFIGRGFVIVTNKVFLNKNKLPQVLLETKSNILYPIIGCLILGNVLIILSFFVGLNNVIVVIFLGLFSLSNLFEINKINLRKVFTVEKLFNYLIIPSILLISSSDINFHYDAAYYHLNHQNWLRESNLIIGMVNIFWPFGMSSIFEYISSILWFKDSLIYLHFLSLIFIHFFFSFLYYQLFLSENKNLKNGSVFILFFAFLDNFGIGGGRNGFIYIQEVGKQDTVVAILFCFAGLITINSIIKKYISELDFIFLSLISFFIFQVKVSGVFIFYSYFILIYLLLKEKNYKIKSILYLQLPTIFFGIIWTVKSFLTTGCIIFPLSSTCLKSLPWYENGSTERIEEYTTNTSFAYMEYFKDPSRSFFDWFNDFFNSNNYAVFSNYYRSVYLNFAISLIIIYLIKKLLFENESHKLNTNLIISTYIIFGISYLIFYGPIPRYSIGILCTIVALFGFYTNADKFKIPSIFIVSLFLVSLSLVPRVNSYINFLNNKSYSLFDPRIEAQHNEIENLGSWVKPDTGDRCWINLNCTMEDKNILINDEDFFKVAYKE